MYAKIDQAIFAQGSELSARNTIWMLSDRNTRSTKVAYWQTHSCHIILTFVLLYNLTWCITSIHLLVLLCGKKVFGGQISKISTTCDIVKINHTTATIWLLFYFFYYCTTSFSVVRMNTSEDSIMLSDSPFCRNSTIGENELQDTSICQNATENFTVLTTQKVNQLYGSDVVTYLTIIYK